MRVTIKAGRAHGTVAVPPSKSMAHRLLIAAGLCSGVSVVRGISLSEDVAATLDCLRALGASCDRTGDTVTVRGVDMRTAYPTQELCCRESGSTLRFFIPLALLCGKEVTLCGSKTLLNRPLTVFETLCREKGLAFSQTDDGVTVQGPLTHGTFTVAGNISSQFITGLLFALPLLAGDSEIRLLPPVESRSYIHMTVAALATFGVAVRWKDENTLFIAGNRTYKSTETAVEGDYSNAAFFAAMNALGGNVTMTGLNENSLQGDRVYVSHLAALCDGCPTIDLTDCPDLAPVLFAVAAAKQGATFVGTRRLKIKESDRAETMAAELRKCGASVTVQDDSVVIAPTPLHPPTVPIDGHNDHRIVMAMTVLLTTLGGEIEGAQAVRKSFPDFFERCEQLGLEVTRHDAE